MCSSDLRRRQLHRSSRLMREEERGLGELELEQTRLPCGVADQVDARVKELPVGQRREGAVRHGTLVGPGLAPGDRLGREQPVGRRRPERQQRSLADGVTEAAVDVDERSLPVLIDALEGSGIRTKPISDAIVELTEPGLRIAMQPKGLTEDMLVTYLDGLNPTLRRFAHQLWRAGEDRKSVV